MNNKFFAFLLISIFSLTACKNEQSPKDTDPVLTKHENTEPITSQKVEVKGNETKQVNIVTNNGAPKPVSMLTEGTISIPVIDGKGMKYYLNKKDDQVHIVNFWATWCPPCLKEMPYFEEINEQYGDDGVEVTLVSVDDPSMHSRVLKLVEKKGLESDVVVFPNGNSEENQKLISTNWQKGALPVTMIYNKHKRFFIEGETTVAELEEQIKKFK